MEMRNDEGDKGEFIGQIQIQRIFRLTMYFLSGMEISYVHGPENEILIAY